jgi:hypothetical protein
MQSFPFAAALLVRCLLLLPVFHAQAQNSSVLEELVSLHYRQVPLEQVLEGIHAQYRVNFSYGKDLLPLAQKVSIEVERVPLREALQTLFQDLPVVFALMGEQVVLKPAEPAASPGKRILHLQGTITDGQTGQGLAYASLQVVGKGLGNVTNGRGEFVLSLPADCGGDSLKISYLGYQPLVLPVAQATTGPLAIALTPGVVQLQAVEVKQQTALSILREALSKIPDNYPTRPVRQTLYLRDQTWQDGEPVQATESIYETFRGDAGKQPLQQVKLVEGRKSRYDRRYADVLKAFPALNSFDVGTNAYFAFACDPTRFASGEPFLGEDGLKRHAFEWEGNTHYDGREVYVIAFDQKDDRRALFKGKIYIDVETLAFIRIEQSLSPKGIAHASLFGSKATEKVFGLGENTVIGVTTDTHYRRLGDKWYLDHVSRYQDLSLVKTKRRFRARITSRSDIVVTDVKTDSIAPFPEAEIASARNLAYRQYGEYHEAFWLEQNIIKPDSAFEEAFRYINARNQRADKNPGDAPEKRTSGQKRRRKPAHRQVVRPGAITRPAADSTGQSLPAVTGSTNW